MGAFDGAAARHNRSTELADQAHALLAFAEPNLATVAPLWADVQALAPTLAPGAPARFFAAHLQAQTAIHYAHLAAMQAAAAGALAYVAGDAAGAAANVSAALGAFDTLLAALRTAEGAGTWHGSYAADGWTWCWGTRQALAHLAGTLAGVALAPGMELPYVDYAIMAYESRENNPRTGTPTFPFAAWTPSAWDALPRFVCAGDLPPSAAAGAAASPAAASACSSTWVGVTLSAPAQVGFFIAPYAARAPVDIYYTLDGSPPARATATLYSGPFTLPAAAATVRAQSFDRATGAALVVDTSAAVLVA